MGLANGLSPFFFWKWNGRIGNNRNPQKPTKKNKGEKWKRKTNGRKRKKSEATPFQRPLLRNPDEIPVNNLWESAGVNFLDILDSWARFKCFFFSRDASQHLLLFCTTFRLGLVNCVLQRCHPKLAGPTGESLIRIICLLGPIKRTATRRNRDRNNSWDLFFVNFRERKISPNFSDRIFLAPLRSWTSARVMGRPHPIARFSKVSRACLEFLPRDVRTNDPGTCVGHPAWKLSLWAVFRSLKFEANLCPLKGARNYAWKFCHNTYFQCFVSKILCQRAQWPVVCQRWFPNGDLILFGDRIPLPPLSSIESQLFPLTIISILLIPCVRTREDTIHR